MPNTVTLATKITRTEKNQRTGRRSHGFNTLSRLIPDALV